jgi:hypothetical protein
MLYLAVVFSVGCIQVDANPHARRKECASDETYNTVAARLVQTNDVAHFDRAAQPTVRTQELDLTLKCMHAIHGGANSQQLYDVLP